MFPHAQHPTSDLGSRPTLAERLRHAVTLLVAFATLEDGERAREEQPDRTDGSAAPVLDLPGLTGRTDGFGPEVAGEDEVARSGRFTRAAARPADDAAGHADAVPAAPRCSPHPHRRTVTLERAERRHGMAPARPQPCLSPTRSAAAAARRAADARAAGLRAGQLVPGHRPAHHRAR